MHAKHNRAFLIGILAFSLLSSVAFADPAEDMARANAFYGKQELGDAYAIMRKLAEQNYLPAQARLGEMLDYTEEDVEAVGWHIMAAFQGNAAGAYNLGKLYLIGEGIKRDPDQAFYWIKFAAEKDDLNAIKLMEYAYQKGADSGLPVQVDLKQAQYWEAKKLPLEAAYTKMEDEKRAAVKKVLEERAVARKKADEEAAKKSR